VVGSARAEMVAVVIRKHLRLVLEASERARVDDPIAIALEAAAIGVLRFGHTAAARRRGGKMPRLESHGRLGGVRGEQRFVARPARGGVRCRKVGD